MSNSATTKTKSSPKPHRAPKDGRKLRPVGSVMNAIRVLRYLAQSGRGEGATQVAKAVEMYPGTCYQLLRTLVQDDLLHFDSVEKKYSLSSGLRDLVATSETAPSDGFPLKRREHMKELSRRFTATVYLIGRLQHEKGVLVDLAQPPEHARNPVISSFETIYQGAMGRVATYLHHPDRSDWPRVFGEMPWDIKPTFEEWSLEVEAVAKKGYAVDRGFRSRGITVIATPICDGLGDPVFYLAALLFSVSLTDDTITQVGNAVKRCAEEVRHEAALRSLAS